MSVSNFVRATIKSAVSSGATTIDVDTASSPFNNPPAPTAQARLFLVDSLDSPTKWEEIEYTGRSAITGGYSLTGVTRNEDSSTGSAQSFDAGHYVVMSPSATTDGQGAIVESGSNANGSYIRYENGMQVCFARLEMSQLDTSRMRVSWTYPKSFNANPVIQHQVDFDNASLTNVSALQFNAGAVRGNGPNSVNLDHTSDGTNDFVSGDVLYTMATAWGTWK